MNSIDKLKELTEELPAVPKLSSLMVDRRSGEDLTATYKVPGGTCMVNTLLSQPDVFVIQTFVSKGGKFPTHIHGEKEYIVVVEGVIEFTIGGDTIKMSPGDSKMLDIEEAHSAKALEDVWFIVINIPRSNDYETST